MTRTRCAAALLLLACWAALATSASAAPYYGGSDFAVSQAFDSGGTLFVAAQSPTNSLMVSSRYGSDFSWHGPFEIAGAGTTLSSPTLALGPEGNLYVGSEGPGHSLYVTVRYPDTTWHGPFQINGTADRVYSTPAMAFSDGTLYVAMQGPNHSLYLTSRDPAGSWLSAPVPILGANSAYSTPALALRSDGTLFLTVRGPSNSLTAIARSKAGTLGAQYQFAGPGTTYSEPTARFDTDGVLYVAAQGPGNSLYESTRSVNGQWNGPVQIAGTAGRFFSAPHQAFDGNRTLFISARGPSNSLMVINRYVDGSWHGPFQLAPNDSFYSATTQVFDTGGTLFVSGQGPRNTLMVSVRYGSDYSWHGPFGLSPDNLIGMRYYPTSVQYGGEDRAVTTAGEISAVAAAIGNAADDPAAVALLDGLDPAERGAVESALAGGLSDGQLIRNIRDGGVYNYAAGMIRWIPSVAVANAVGADLNSAKRVTTAGIAGLTRGPDIGPYRNSWNYGGSNRTIDVAAEVNATRSALAGLSAEAVGPFRDGVAPGDLQRVDDYTPTPLSWAGAGVTLDAIEVPGAADIAWLDDGDTTADASAYGRRGCRVSRNTRAIKDALHITIGSATLRTRFCWNKSKHIAAWDGHVLTIDEHLSGWAKALGWELVPGDKTSYPESWNGYGRGQVRMEEKFTLKKCAWVGPCFFSDEKRFVTYGHYDGTAVDRSTN